MTFEEYQKRTADTAFYPQGLQGFVYCTLALGGETGEIQEKVKKIIRDKGGVASVEDKRELMKEIGDVLWYLSQLSTELGLDLGMVATSNIDKLASRKERGTLQGSGDNR